MALSDFAIILLAAGSSSRMGTSKQLLFINDETLLERSSRAALNCGVPNIFVVLGANAQNHLELLKNLPVNVIINPDWKKGMGNSLKTGLSKTLKVKPNLQAVIILVCDQPYLQKENIQALINKFSETKKPIIASKYADIIGVPVLFEKQMFDEILKSEDQHGAKKIINQNSMLVETVDFINGETDLDTPEDYQNFISKY
jgi:molybdenum cofactor cytidylyltransferase